MKKQVSKKMLAEGGPGADGCEHEVMETAEESRLQEELSYVKAHLCRRLMEPRSKFHLASEEKRLKVLLDTAFKHKVSNAIIVLGDQDSGKESFVDEIIESYRVGFGMDDGTGAGAVEEDEDEDEDKEMEERPLSQANTSSDTQNQQAARQSQASSPPSPEGNGLAPSSANEDEETMEGGTGDWDDGVHQDQAPPAGGASVGAKATNPSKTKTTSGCDDLVPSPGPPRKRNRPCDAAVAAAAAAAVSSSRQGRGKGLRVARIRGQIANSDQAALTSLADQVCCPNPNNPNTPLHMTRLNPSPAEPFPLFTTHRFFLSSSPLLFSALRYIHIALRGETQ